ncbi:MAG: DUF3551 domain-containing protein [Xanthobacteraceae bacterium]|nr:DUF3551 domain-containing protein [Xanthobacteraceae bacterium]
MRATLLAMLVLGATAAMSSAPAQAHELPFCIKGQGYAQAHGECRFWTYEQCQATASGLRAYCEANPFYVGGPPRHPRPRGRYSY